MDGDRVMRIMRTLDARSRRRLLSALPGAAIAVGPLALQAAAKGKKHKHKKPCPTCPTGQDCPTCPSPPPALTCPATCPSICDFCYVRPQATTLCGNAGITLCDTPCSSDANCGGGPPFCVSQVVSRATGETFDACPTPGSFCVSIPSCAA